MGVVRNLIAAHATHAEVTGIGPPEVPAAHRCARPHRKAFGERDTGARFEVEQRRQCGLLGVIGAGGVAGRRANALIPLAHEVIGRERFADCVSPMHSTHFFMQTFGKCFGQPVGEGRREDGTVIIVRRLRGGDDVGKSVPGRDCKGAHVVCHAALDRCDKIGEGERGPLILARRLLPERMNHGQCLGP